MATLHQAMLDYARANLEEYRELRQLYADSRAAEALDGLILEWMNIRPAQSYAARLAANNDEAASICSDFGLEPAILFGDIPMDWIASQWLQPALAAAERLPDHQRNAARHLLDLGNVAQIQKNHNLSISIYRQALDNSVERTDLWSQAVVLERMGDSFAALGEVLEATKHYGEAMILAHESGAEHVKGRALCGKARLARRDDDLDRARGLCLQALEEAEKEGCLHCQGVFWGEIGDISRLQGKLPRAVEEYDRAIEISLASQQLKNASLFRLRRARVQETIGDGCSIADYEEAVEHERVLQERGDKLGLIDENDKDSGYEHRLVDLSAALVRRGDFAAALKPCEELLRIARDIHTTGIASSNLALVCCQLGQTERAIELFSQALAIARDAGEKQLEAHALLGLGRTHLVNRDEHREAIKPLEEALEIIDTLEQSDEVAKTRLSVMDNLGIAHHRLGNLTDAIGLHAQCLQIARLLGESQTEAEMIMHLAWDHCATGRHQRKAELLEAAMKIIPNLWPCDTKADILNAVARLRLEEKRPELAISLLEEALEIIRKIKNPTKEGKILFSLATAHRDLEQFDLAILRLKDALQIARKVRDKATEINLLGCLVICHLSCHNPEQATASFQLKLELAREVRNTEAEREAWAGLAMTEERHETQ